MNHATSLHPSIPSSATHVVVPVELFSELVAEAEVGDPGFGEASELWEQVSFLPESVDEPAKAACTATSEEGRKHCVKPLYRARSGELWPHAGGHFFATPEGAALLASGSYDGRAVLSQLRPAVADEPDGA